MTWAPGEAWPQDPLPSADRVEDVAQATDCRGVPWVARVSRRRCVSGEMFAAWAEVRRYPGVPAHRTDWRGHGSLGGARKDARQILAAVTTTTIPVYEVAP